MGANKYLVAVTALMFVAAVMYEIMIFKEMFEFDPDKWECVKAKGEVYGGYAPIAICYSEKEMRGEIYNKNPFVLLPLFFILLIASISTIKDETRNKL